MRTQIYLSNDILYSNLSEEAKIAYISLLYNAYDKEQTYALHSLLELFSTNKLQTNLSKKILQGLNELDANKLIKINSHIDQYLFTIDISPIWIENNSNFTIIETEDIKKIIKIPNIKVIKIILYYCIITSTINRQTHYGFTSIRKLCEYTKYSSQTIMKINHILIQYKVLGIIKNNNIYQNTKGKIKKETNKYYLTKDESRAQKNISNRALQKSKDQAWTNYNKELMNEYKQLKLSN